MFNKCYGKSFQICETTQDQHSGEVNSGEHHKLLKSQEQNVQQFRNKFTFVSQIHYKQQLHLIQKFPVIWTPVNGRM